MPSLRELFQKDEQKSAAKASKETDQDKGKDKQTDVELGSPPTSSNPAEDEFFAKVQLCVLDGATLDKWFTEHGFSSFADLGRSIDRKDHARTLTYPMNAVEYRDAESGTPPDHVKLFVLQMTTAFFSPSFGGLHLPNPVRLRIDRYKSYYAKLKGARRASAKEKGLYIGYLPKVKDDEFTRGLPEKLAAQAGKGKQPASASGEGCLQIASHWSEQFAMVEWLVRETEARELEEN
jgi:hypothetical protein